LVSSTSDPQKGSPRGITKAVPRVQSMPFYQHGIDFACFRENSDQPLLLSRAVKPDFCPITSFATVTNHSPTV
jgi:hypothetical protein